MFNQMVTSEKDSGNYQNLHKTWVKLFPNKKEKAALYTRVCVCTCVFFRRTHNLIGYFEVTWHLSMKLFQPKSPSGATLQNPWRQRIPRMLAGDRRYSEVSVTNFRLQNFELYIYNKTLKDWSLVDCEQPLFFIRFSKGSARARAFSGEAARREKRGRQPEKKK